MSDPKNPSIGDLAVDATELAPIIVDLPPGARRGLLSSQPGCADVVTELRSNQKDFGARAGVRDEEVSDLEGLLANIARIDRVLPAARKQVELLEETRAVQDDTLQRRIYQIAQSVERRSRINGNGDLAARYEKSCQYRSAIGVRAARTRRRNEVSQAEDEVIDHDEAGDER